MAVTVDTAFINQFSGALHINLEQRGSLFRPSVELEMANGEKHFFDRLGAFTASEVVARKSPTELQDAPHSRRMASVRRYKANTYLDNMDKLKMLIDPTNSYTRGLGRAQGRNLDDVIIAAALGTAATGQDGSGSTAFDTANQQVAHGSAALTVAKLNSALQILEANEVDMDVARIYLAAGAKGINGLLSDSTNQLTSFDFQADKALAGTAIPKFRGLNIIRTQRIPEETAATTQRALMYTEDTIKVAMNQDINVHVDERTDLDYLLQVATYMQYGAVRMEEESIVDILFQ